VSADRSGSGVGARWTPVGRGDVEGLAQRGALQGGGELGDRGLGGRQVDQVGNRGLEARAPAYPDGPSLVTRVAVAEVAVAALLLTATWVCR
jgi:hypothetical protein